MKSIDYLVNDGRYDRQELKDLMDLALHDGIVTEDEKRVLRDIFNTAQISGVDSETQALIQSLSQKYGL